MFDDLTLEERIGDEAYNLALQFGLGSVSRAVICERLKIKPLRMSEAYPNIRRLYEVILSRAQDEREVGVLADGLRMGVLDPLKLDRRLLQMVRRHRSTV